MITISKVKYYSVSRILEAEADYMIIYGERSNGKTTSILDYALKRHIESDYTEQLGVIRRWEEDFKGKNGQQLYEGIIALGWIEKYTKGKYNSVTYIGRRWYLTKFDELGNKLYQAEEPFALAFAISSEEHYKSLSFPNIRYILFDEFITRSYYLPDEFIKFQNLLSTIIRLRNDVKIFMCGNTVNKYCPYFSEMGLVNVKKQIKGSIDIYTYGDSGLRVAVEYSDFETGKKKSNKYFAFNNPKLQMITNGSWEISIYPHLPCKYKPNEIKCIYFIYFNEELLQCEIIKSEELKTMFTFIHRKTTPIKDEKHLVFTPEIKGHKNYRRKINKVYDEIGRKIYYFYQIDKVFYQSNEIGEIVRNYILWCLKESI